MLLGMKTKLFCLLVALSVFALGACAPVSNTDVERVGEAQEAFVSYADPTAIKQAIDGGATWSGNLLLVDGVSNYCVLANGAWSLSTEGGDTIGRGVFRQIQAGEIDYDGGEGGEYLYTLIAPSGRWQVAESDGVVVLLDP